ncbi:MAG: hypothetical protein QOK31_1718 [Solirubrobacteraceae bacterium]|jgi:hypothetical protein|nr:hypothetical protein [Solirubrobacteraceae bacterium]
MVPVPERWYERPVPVPAVPRPVADAPVDRLLGRATELAREWLLGMLAAAPLEALDALDATSFAQRAPELCGAVARALGSDAELARLGPAGELAELAAAAGRLVGVRDPAASVAAVERLRGILWAGSLEVLDRPDAELVAALGARLSHVCSVVAGAACAEEGRASPMAARPSAERLFERSGPRGLDARIAAGGRFALLLVELEDVRRLALADAGPVDRALGALREAVRGGDLVVQQGEGRAWVIADGLDRAGAGVLAHRMATSVRALGSWRGAPLLVSVGVAVHPEDGRDAPALVGAAEEGVFAARAAGTPVDR